MFVPRHRSAIRNRQRTAIRNGRNTLRQHGIESFTLFLERSLTRESSNECKRAKVKCMKLEYDEKYQCCTTMKVLYLIVPSTFQSAKDKTKKGKNQEWTRKLGSVIKIAQVLIRLKSVLNAAERRHQQLATADLESHKHNEHFHRKIDTSICQQRYTDSNITLTSEPYLFSDCRS